MAALHNLYDFLDEFNEIFGEKAEYEIKLKFTPRFFAWCFFCSEKSCILDM